MQRHDDVPIENIGRNAYRLLNEAPEVVGKMSSVLGKAGSLDSAVRAVSEEGPALSRKMFRKIADDADTRIEPDISLSLTKVLSSLPRECSAYSMAVRMVVSASSAKEESERSRMLSEASETAVNGLRDAGKSFGASLNTPCMIVFGVGIMIPMVVMSILPMMGMSGIFGISAIDSDMISVIVLLMIPAFILSVTLSLKEKNPLLERTSKNDISAVLPLLSIIPFSFVLYNRTSDFVTSFCLSLTIGSLVTIVCNYKAWKISSENRRISSAIGDSIFEIGSRLSSGQPFVTAVYDTFSTRKELASLAIKFSNTDDIERGDTESAIMKVFSRISSESVELLTSICRACNKDLREAGKLAQSLGKQIKDRETLRNGIRNDLKSMTDTMFGTAAVFAPLVLGLSVAMLSPMESLGVAADIGNTSCILAVYLAELCGIISLLLSFIRGRCGPADIVSGFASVAPVSMIVFLVAMNLAL